MDEDIVTSYRKISQVHAKVALLPMTEFEILNKNATLQRTVFGEKYEVITNFADTLQHYHKLTLDAEDFVCRQI